MHLFSHKKACTGASRLFYVVILHRRVCVCLSHVFRARVFLCVYFAKDILRELLDVLSTQSTNAHATRLEVIIIYLIFVEVAIELVWNVIVKDIFRFFSDDC